MEIFSLTLSQMIVFFVFMAIGYAFKRLNVTPDSTGAVLSKLELYVFLPALCFKTFSSNLRPEKLAHELPILGYACAVLAVTFALSIPLAHLFSKNQMTRAVYIYALTIPNIGYIGYPLVGAVFGNDTLLDFMVFTLPFNLFIYTVGMYILNPKHELSWKSLLSPILLAIFAGAVIGLSGLTIPSVVSGLLDTASGCMGPIAMILTGYVLARGKITEMISNPRMYIASFIRLIALPAIIGAVMYVLRCDTYITLLTVCMLALPMGLNNVVFPEAFGGDSKTGAQSCFVSNVLALATVPIAYGIFAAIFK